VGKVFKLFGKIDRIDIAKDEEGRYLRIIDYKSSSNYIKLNDVLYGLQLQLLTYLDAVAKIEELEPTAVLYFSLIEEKLDKRKSKEEIEKDIKENFKMNGLVVSDVKLIKMMDKTLETGASSIIPAYITKERRDF
jgi:ATP-dependent helicase/nuclease subunit B